MGVSCEEKSPGITEGNFLLRSGDCEVKWSLRFLSSWFPSKEDVIWGMYFSFNAVIGFCTGTVEEPTWSHEDEWKITLV